MKVLNVHFSFFVILIFSFDLYIIKSFGIKDADEHLLIFFIKEKNEISNELLTEEAYIKKLLYRGLFSTFNIGLPNQNLKFYYEMKDTESSISQQFYLSKRSTSYRMLTQKKYSNYSQEIFFLDTNKKIDNFSFFLKPKSNEEDFNYIGLGFGNNSFLYQLQNTKYIKNRIFSFLFGDDSFSETKIFDGQILIGCYPHDISPYFDETELNFISLNNKEKWEIEFDYIKYNDEVLTDKLVEFDVNLNLLIGPEKFRKKLLSSFFKEFIENGKCKENYFHSGKNITNDDDTYIYYSFDNSVKFKEIPNLYFFSKELNETFMISFANLFNNHNQKYYFNIIFSKNPNNKWILGQKFLKEHKFVFDLEERRIGYYKSSENSYGLFILLFCVIFFGLIYGFGYLRGYYLKKNDINTINNQALHNIRKEYAYPTEQASNINEKNKNENKETKENKEKPKKD